MNLLGSVGTNFWLRFSLLSLGPFAEFHGFVQLYHLVLENFDLGSASSLDIEDEHVHQAFASLGCQVGAEHSPRDSVWRAVRVGTDNARFNRLILPVQDDLLPGSGRCVVNIVAANEQNAIIVELLDLFNRGHALARLPVRLVDEGLADGQEGRVEGVAELKRCRDTLSKFRVSQAFVACLMQHL